MHPNDRSPHLKYYSQLKTNEDVGRWWFRMSKEWEAIPMRVEKHMFHR